MPDLEREFARVQNVLRLAAVVVGAVSRNRYSQRLREKNRKTLREQAEVLRDLASVLDVAAEFIEKGDA